MKNNTPIIIIIIAIVIGGIALYAHNNKKTTVDTTEETPVVATTEDVKGCYVSTLAKDVYSLNIAAQNDDVVSGTLVFKNFEKDSSAGTFKGMYRSGVLVGDYTFNSEGMQSVMQVAFKKQGDNFVRGYGDMDATGTRFADISKLSYDPNQTFKPSTLPCATTTK